MSSQTETKPEETKVEAMNDCVDLVKEAYASSDEIKTQASELVAALAEAKATIEALKAEKEEAATDYENEKKKKFEEMNKMKAELDATNEILAAYKDKEEEMKKKEKNMKRMASLIEAGLDNESAVSEVEKFESLADEAFENMVNLLAAMKMKKEDMSKKEQDAMMMKKMKAEDVSEALETAEPESNVDLSVGSDASDSELENTRAALVDFVYNRLGKTLNKGE